MGPADGSWVGTLLGWGLGCEEGTVVGCEVGTVVGGRVGLELEGAAVGSTVQSAQMRSHCATIDGMPRHTEKNLPMLAK